MDNKQFVSKDNLVQYDALMKEKMAVDNAATLGSAKAYADAEVAKKSAVEFCIWEEND